MEALDDWGLEDIRYTGTWFTWERERTAANNVRKRLTEGYKGLE